DGVGVDVAPLADGIETEECRWHGRVAQCRATTWTLAGARLVAADEMLEERADPRDRAWYRGALANEGGRWGAPFVQEADGPLKNRCRMTCAVALPGGAPEQGVAEASLSLDAMLADVRAMQPSPGTLTFITDLEGRPILLPPLDEFRGIESMPVGR